MPPLSACRLLVPPYLDEIPRHPDPPLGSILLWRPLHALATSDLLDAHACAPWCSLVAELPPDTRTLDRNSLFDALSSLACLPVFLDGRHGPVEAVRSRRPPTPSDVIRYVCRRPHCSALGDQLARVFAESAKALTGRTARRHVRWVSAFSMGHWAHVLRLAQVKMRPDESVESLADRYGSNVHTLRRHVQECLNVPFDWFHTRVGWEWRVEAALRNEAAALSTGESGGGGMGGEKA